MTTPTATTAAPATTTARPPRRGGANLRSILVNQSIPAILALGATIPIVTGRFDLSIGYGIGLAHVVAMWLLVTHGVPWPIVAVLVLAGGLIVGLVNGALVE